MSIRNPLDVLVCYGRRRPFFSRWTSVPETVNVKLTIGEMMSDDNAWQVSRECLEEAFTVAKALKIPLDVADPVEHVRALSGNIPGAKPSMLLDALRGSHGEIDVINGSVVRFGRKVGVPTPFNSTVVNLVKAWETTLPTQRQANV